MSLEGTTQGDPLAMAMYAVSFIPLIYRLETPSIKQVWYADDASACGKLSSVKDWWDQISAIGPGYGYFPNASKTWIITKQQYHAEPIAIFKDSNLNITTEGKRHLGVALGTRTFVESFVKKQISEWISEIKLLSQIAVSQPHAAYVSLTHSLIH